MQRCPQCQEPLSPAPGGRRRSCGLCGWVEQVTVDEPLAIKAQEIASQQPLETETFWRYAIPVLALLALLLLGLNSLFSAYFRPPSDSSDSPTASPVESYLPSSSPDLNTVTPSPEQSLGQSPAVTGPSSDPNSLAAPAASVTPTPAESPSASGSVTGSPSSGASSSASPSASAAESPSASPSVRVTTPPNQADGVPNQLPSGMLITPPPVSSASP